MLFDWLQISVSLCVDRAASYLLSRQTTYELALRQNLGKLMI